MQNNDDLRAIAEPFWLVIAARIGKGMTMFGYKIASLTAIAVGFFADASSILGVGGIVTLMFGVFTCLTAYKHSENSKGFSLQIVQDVGKIFLVLGAMTIIALIRVLAGG